MQLDGPGHVWHRLRWDSVQGPRCAVVPLFERRGRAVERSLYERANGYNYDAVKVFMPAGSKQPVIVHYTEHCPLTSALRLFG